MGALDYRHKRWCEFTATFLPRAARVAIFLTQVGAVHLNRLALPSFSYEAMGQSPLPSEKNAGSSALSRLPRAPPARGGVVR